MTRKALNPITAATIVVIMYMIMPILSVAISTYITTYAYMLLVVFLIGFIVLSGGIQRLGKIITLLMPLMIYVGCTFFTNADTTVLWGYNSMLFIFPVILGYYFFYYRAENMNIFIAFIVFSILLTAITTIIGLIQFPLAARTLATIASSDDPENIRYSWRNIGGYNFVYTSVLLYPILILAHKLKKINLFIFLIITVALFVLIVLSEYTTALILFLLSTLLYLIGRNTSARQLLIIGILFFLAIFLLWPVISNFILWFANLFNSDVLNERLTALAGGLTGLENSESNRLELFRMSLSGFWSSPFFGKIMGTDTSVGGHSFVLDTLANYGIIGGVALVFIYRNVYRLFFSPFNEEKNFGFVLWSFAQAIILSIVNTGMWLNVLAFFIPALLSVIYKINSEDNYESSLDS